jgi:peptidoglycan/LPS O-acetylase OafA/YrhL
MERLRNIDGIRGIAALGVVLFHFGAAILPTVNPNPLTPLFAFGEHGVEVFFTISGFIIPYALFYSGYRWSDLGSFMLRRYTRIAPLAYISAVLMILYHGLALLITGRPVNTVGWPGVNSDSLLGNLLFHPELFDTSWFNFVFWTLMIEFQFYLLMGLLFPLFTDERRRWMPVVIMGGILLLAPVSEGYFFHHSPYFILGMVVFLLHRQRISWGWAFAIMGAAVAITCWRGEWLPAAFAVLASALLRPRRMGANRILDLLGELSYSLYIVHVPVGYFAESLMKRISTLHLHGWGQLLLMLLYTLLALVSAFALNRLVERPLMRYLHRSRKMDPGSTLMASTQ